ncbi:MAG TPA: (Fe-S)-binding protein [Candidatus Dormibacteraeota bacterium]|nr:(Fe-S)-binding protein [Candidatus Dormibacteraeota bacterium]
MAEPATPRPRFLADVYEAASRCNKCSLCQAVCPTYLVNPVEWETARGRVTLIRDAIEGRVDLADIADGPLSTCLTCNNCVAACAPRVPTGEIVSRARQELNAQRGHPFAQTLVLRSLLPHPGMLALVHRLSRAARRTGLDWLARHAGLTSLLGAPGAFLEHAGPLPARTAHHRAVHLPAMEGTPRGRVALFICCYQNLVAPEASEAVMHVLGGNGYEVVAPRLGCSGLPARTLGDREAMLDMARRNVERLRDLEVDALIGDVTSCTGQVQRYGELLAGEPRHARAAASISGRTWRAAEFLDRAGMRAPLGALRWRVAYDEPCSLPLGGDARTAPYRLLRAIPRLELRPLAETEMCCGGAGDYFRREPERSAAILARKLAHVAESGAEVLVTENISCLVQLRDGARRHAPGLRVLHLFEVLWASMQRAHRLDRGGIGE